MPSAPSVKSRAKRPLLVTLLAAVVFLLSAADFGRAVVALLRRPTLIALNLSIPLWLVAGSGAAWGIVWLAESWGLWALQPRARAAAIILFVLYPITMLGMQAIYAQGAYERDRLPFEAITSALLAGLVALILSRPGIRQSFDRPPKEPDHER
jgi:hypothetical protein